MGWTAAAGGDHNGDNWSPATGTTIGGIHTNIGTFTAPAAGTLTLVQGAECKIYADSIVQAGSTINGQGKGYSGGVTRAYGGGPGGGEGTNCNGDGANGGGYGGIGGVGDSHSSGGGSTYGSSANTIIQMGSGGGGSYQYSGANGGGSILLEAQAVTLGTIDLGGDTPSRNYDTGGGGGSGGGLLVICKTLVCATAVMNCNGGAGGNGFSAGGGGGAGGIAKFYYDTSDSVPTGRTTVTAGAAGTGGTPTAAGIGTENAYSVTGRASTGNTVGQTFNCNIAGSVTIIDIQAYCSLLTTPGNFYLTIYDSPDKNINYGSVLDPIASTGLNTWTFSSPIILPNGLNSYYFEIGHSGTSNGSFRYVCNEKYTDGNMYRTGVEIDSVDMYFIVNAYGNLQNPKIYNMDDKHTKCEFGKLLTGAEHRINSDGTGTIYYYDTFDSANQKYKGDSAEFNGLTQGAGYLLFNASDEFIYWKYDCKYPIVGIPTLASKINLVSGSGKWQIAEEINGEPDTWHDIYTTLPAGNHLTTYELDAPDLSLDGHRVIYFRFQCVSGQQNVEYITLNADVDTSSAQVPTVNVDGASTFRCDQADTSTLDCDIRVYYNDTKY